MQYAKRTDLGRANQGNNFIHMFWECLSLRTLVQKDEKETKKFCAEDTSVLSPKYEVFCRRSVGCFSRRERSAHICVIRVERATRKNSQLAPAQRGCDENGPAAALLVGHVSV